MEEANEEVIVEQKEELKTCPFLDKTCIGNECAIRVSMQQQVLGTRKLVTVCPLPALVMVISSLIGILTNPPQKLNLPGIKL